MRAQANLFDYKACNCSRSGVQGPTANQDDNKDEVLIRIVSDLEEAKFGRLWRHIHRVEDPNDPFGHKLQPLAFQNAEVYLDSIEDVDNYFSGHFFNQFVHLSTQFDTREAAQDYCEDSLLAALVDLRERPELVETIDGTRTWKFYGYGPGQERTPEDYFFITNVRHNIVEHDDECPANLSRVARRLFRSILEIPTDCCPGFHIITPDSMVSGPARSDIVTCLVDLLNAPSSYELIARDGKISVIPTVEYGMVFASEPDVARDPSSVLGATVTGCLAPPSPVNSQALGDFEFLLNSPRTKEADLQDFLKAHQEFLFAMDQRYCEIRPHVCLHDVKGERLVPDFMARIHDSNIWDVIELKLPFAKLTVRHGDVQRASATAARGIAELLRHRDYFSVSENRRRVTQRFGITAQEPCLVLVIGRGHPREPFEWNGKRPGLPNVRIVSYDYLFERARRMCQEIDVFKQQTPT